MKENTRARLTFSVNFTCKIFIVTFFLKDSGGYKHSRIVIDGAIMSINFKIII